MLVDFAIENELVIMNTTFQQHPRRLYTWTSPDGRTKNQIDYILVPKRWRTSVRCVKTLPGADCGSDHELLIVNIKVKLKVLKHNKPVIRYNLQEITDGYRTDIKNRFEALMTVAEEKTPDELANDIAKAILGAAEANIPKQRLKKNLWISKNKRH